MRHTLMFMGRTTIVFIFLLTGAAFADFRFENGFRGIAWGTHKDQLPDLGLSQKALGNINKEGDSSVMFMDGVGNLDMNFDTIPLLSIFLKFRNQVFHGADLIFKPEHRQSVYSRITAETRSLNEP
jgi:hypothetical protein